MSDSADSRPVDQQVRELYKRIADAQLELQQLGLRHGAGVLFPAHPGVLVDVPEQTSPS